MADNLTVQDVSNNLVDTGQSSLNLSSQPQPQAPSLWDDYLEQKDAKEHPTELSDAYGAMWRQDGFTNGLVASIAGNQMMPQKGYAAYGDPKEWADLTKGIPEEWHKEFYNASSPAHAQYLRGLLLDKQDDLGKLSKLDTTGNAARMMFGLVNPEMLLAGLATGGLADAAVLARTGTTLKSALALKSEAEALKAVARGETAGVTEAGVAKETGTALTRVDPLADPSPQPLATRTGLATTTGTEVATKGTEVDTTLSHYLSDEPLALESGITIEGEFTRVGEQALLGTPEVAGAEAVASTATSDAMTASIKAADAMAKATSSSGLIEGMGAAGVLFGGHEAIRQSVNFENDNWHVLEAGLIASAFSAPFVALRSSELNRMYRASAMERDVLQILKVKHDNPTGTLTAEAQATLDKYGIARENIANADGSFIASGSIGAAQVAGIRDPNAPSFMIKGRKSLLEDLYAGFNKQANSELKGMADDLIKDPLASSRTVAQSETAGEIKKRYQRTVSGLFHAETKDAFFEVSKLHGWGLWARAKNAHKFYNDITRLTGGDHTIYGEYPIEAKPHLDRAVSAQRKVYSDMLEKAQAAGVKGAEHLTVDDFYVNRAWRQDKMREIANTHGEDEMYKFMSESALAKGIHEFTPEKAKSFIQTVMKLEYSHQLHDLPLAMHDIGFLRKELEAMQSTSGHSAFSSDAIDDFMQAISERKAATDGGNAAPLKFRMPLDENYSKVMANGQTLKMRDFFENDSRLVTDRYVNTLAGHTALAEKGYHSKAEFASRLNEADKEHQDNLFTRSAEEYSKYRKWAEDIHSQLIGKPMSMQRFDGVDRWLNAYRALTRSSLLGELGLVAAGELKNAIALTSMRAMTKQMPSLGAFFQAMREGHIPNKELQKDINSIWGFGHERAMAYARQHELTDFSYDVQLTKFENWANSASHVTDVVSGNGHFTSFTREATASMKIQELSDVANGFKTLTASERERLVANGISDHNIDAVMADLKAHTELDGETITKINYEQWALDNPETFNDFRLAVDRSVREAIQDHDIGEMPAWTHSPTGKIFSELRTFTLGAHTKQFLKGLHYRDATTMAQWSYGFVGESLAYSMQTSMNYAHDPEKLKKLLTPEAIAKAAINRMGVLGVLPMALETPTQILTGHTLLGNSTANTGSRNFLVPPSLAQAQKQYGAFGTIGTAISPFSDKQLTASQVKNGFQGLPLSNTYGVRNLVDMLSSQYPAN